MSADSWDEPTQPWPVIIDDPVQPFHPEELINMTYQVGAYPYEIGAMYEIGDGSYAIAGPRYAIGAPLQNMPNLSHMQLPRLGGQQITPVLQMPTPTIVRTRDPTESRLQHLGCNQETPIVVAAVGTATAQPQKVFKAERFIVPDTVAPDFMIDSITVGVYLQSPANGSIPAQAFTPSSIYSNVDFDTCQISQQMVVRPRNIGGADRPFFSSFVGRALQ